MAGAACLGENAIIRRAPYPGPQTYFTRRDEKLSSILSSK